MKQLEIGEDYLEIFNYAAHEAGGKLIYNGGISWTATEDGREMTMDSQSTTDNALEYINRASSMMGRF